MSIVKDFSIISYSALDIGEKREINEDNLLVFEPEDRKTFLKKGNLYIVADGVGGLERGDIASRVAVETIKEEYYSSKSINFKRALSGAIKKANLKILSMSSKEEKMCSTAVCLVIKDNKTFIMNVGDSRAYLLRDNNLIKLTQDHSYVSERVKAGELTEEEARIHPRKNIILRCLGDSPKLRIDSFSHRILKGDKFLLCSDGLWGELQHDKLEEIVRSESKKAIKELVSEANKASGNDNISIVLVNIF